MKRPATLEAWLAYLETLHPKAIALGLERVAAVHAKMGLALDCPVVTVTGTNGKGSTCAMLEAVLRRAGYRTGLYSSPHLSRYNERVRIGGEPQDDAALVAAFNAVEDARGDIPLTYFEYGTLAAFHAFARAGLDAAILEVGLGGRLDAVNVVDADVAVVTSIDLDHMDYLGPTRGDIAREKAGIFRAGRPVVCAEPDPPSSLIEHARALGAPVTQIGRDYGFVAENGNGDTGVREGSASACRIPRCAARTSSRTPRPCSRSSTFCADACTSPPARSATGSSPSSSRAASRCSPGGRRSCSTSRTIRMRRACSPRRSARWASFPKRSRCSACSPTRTCSGVIAAVTARVDRWFVASLPGPRGATAAAVRAELVRAGIAADAIRTFDDIESGFAAARDEAGEADRIVVFGSFLTVAAALAAVKPGTGRATQHG